jgi:DNA modification methylase
MCGDSTLEEDMEKLMDGHTADMVFTDPPYNVDYKGTGDKTSEGIMNDKMDDEAFHKFLTAAFLVMNKFTNERGGCYVFHSHKTASTFEKTLQDSGFHIDTQLIWNKPSAGLGMNAYRTKHEPFFYCYMDSPYFYGDRTGTTVWKIPEDIEAQIAWFKKALEKIDQENVTLWSMKREDVSDYVHPTQKPVELVVRAILNSSKSKDVVLDQFLGSGTTLIAAEKARRRCFGMELDPKYLDTIVSRYVQYTGVSMITKNGQPFEWK